MIDDVSDPEFSDFDSPLSLSLIIQAKPRTILSTDRLYSLSNAQKHTESEHSSLLFHSDGTRSYHSIRSTPQHELNNPFEVTGESTSPQPLRMLTRKISRVFQSKAYDYDNDKESLAAVGSGERVW